MRYFVTWTMDIDADTPEEAARKAFKIHRDPESIATVFTVRDNFNGKAKVYDVDPSTLEVTEF